MCNSSFLPFIDSIYDPYYSLFENIERAVKYGYKKVEIPHSFAHVEELQKLGYKFKISKEGMGFTIIITI